MPICRRFHPCLAVLLFVPGLLAAAAPAAATLAAGGPLRVRILFDNSGSMYPGYRPPGTPGRLTRGELGVPFFYQDADFQQWLGDFVARQTILDAGTVGMWTFTSSGAFAAGDIQPAHPEVPIARFDVARAVRGFPRAYGQTTYLTESLGQFADGFEGLVWLITDNIVETRAGTPDVDVKRFFAALRDDPRYASVHLFKCPIERAGQRSALAIYGILVSPAPVPAAVVAYYDRKLRGSFRFANRRQGDPPPPLFPGREHLKLRDLRIDALELQAVPNLEAVLDDPRQGSFGEGQRVQLALRGEVQSYLTQHSVIGGRYRLEVGDLEPEAWARRDLGARTLAASSFPAVRGDIEEPIAPNGARTVAAVVHAVTPVSLAGGGLAAWIRLALHGAAVRYTGTLRMSFDDVRVRLEREPMAGIFGLEQAPEIFDFQTVSDLAVAPCETQVSFVLRTGASRTAILLLVLAVLAALLALAAALLGRREWYTVRITGTPDRLVALRRLASHEIVHAAQPLGRLARGVSGAHDFRPNLHSAAFTIQPAPPPDTWDVRFRDGHGCQLAIVARHGARRSRQSATAATRPAALPRPEAMAPRGAAAPSSLPKIDRP